MRFAVEVVKRVRAAVGDRFILIFRISAMDMLEGGLAWDEVVSLGKAIEAAGANIISTHFCWHEAPVPTIATMVPRAAFTRVTGRLRKELKVPMITSNRINMPDVAEAALARGDADLISMARPMLADPELVLKAAQGREDEINTCIACNQACLDHTFGGRQQVTCLVNPRACNETLLRYLPVAAAKRIAVVGAGPAGLAYATVASKRGHRVTLFDAAAEIGGQFNLAKQIPGKEEFEETLRYFRGELAATGVDVRLGVRVGAADLLPGGVSAEGFDVVVLATGVVPRVPEVEGVDHHKVVSYLDVLRDKAPVGATVAIMGAGGIGFDVAEYLTQAGPSTSLDPQAWAAEWGVDTAYRQAGGLTEPQEEPPARKVYLLQRKDSKVGAGLGRTTGWIHRTVLKNRGVVFIAGAVYERIDDAGLHVRVGERSTVLPVDTIVLATGQEPMRDLYAVLQESGADVRLIGGADVAAELDAKRAIKQGTEVAVSI